MNRLVKGLNNLFELGHPGEAQMAVLKENPQALSLTLLNQVLSGLLLSRTKRDGSHARVHTDFTAVLVPRGIGIGTSRKHENEWRHVSRVTEAGCEGEWWRVNVLLTNLFNDEVLHSLGDSISSDSLEQHNLLEAVKRRTPVAR